MIDAEGNQLSIGDTVRHKIPMAKPDELNPPPGSRHFFASSGRITRFVGHCVIVKGGGIGIPCYLASLVVKVQPTI